MNADNIVDMPGLLSVMTQQISVDLYYFILKKQCQLFAF